MTSKGITGLLALALATAALVLLFFVIGSAQGATKAYDGGGPARRCRPARRPTGE